jgi:hypothetical protein
MLKLANRLVKPQRTLPSLVSLSLSTKSLPFARHFHSSFLAMVAHKIDGTAIAKYVSVGADSYRRSIREQVKSEILEIQKRNPRFKPGLAIVQVGDRPDSSTYVRMKGKAAEEVVTHSILGS